MTEIYKAAGKDYHIRQIAEKTGASLEDMIFFDNQTNNTSCVAGMKVTSCNIISNDFKIVTSGSDSSVHAWRCDQSSVWGGRGKVPRPWPSYRAQREIQMVICEKEEENTDWCWYFQNISASDCQFDIFTQSKYYCCSYLEKLLWYFRMTEQISDKMKAVDISDSDQNPTNINGNNTTTKRQDYLEWSEYFMAVSFLSAMRSKDPATQVRVHFKHKHSID